MRMPRPRSATSSLLATQRTSPTTESASEPSLNSRWTRPPTGTDFRVFKKSPPGEASSTRPVRVTLSAPPQNNALQAVRGRCLRASAVGNVVSMATPSSKELKTFKNPAPKRKYQVTFDCPEFTCLCPLTGQPDFATFKICYLPDKLCVELKSLKLYLWSYRNEGAFHEAVTNQILDHLVDAVSPRSMTVEGNFFVRGGISTLITARFEKKGSA